jgi:uncharacterized membrane protein
MHLYRGELARSDTWRSRLDTTTNWALTTAAAAISYGFANGAGSHAVLLLGILLVLTFLTIETRRYRYYDLWIRRVRLLEEGYWVPIIRNEPLDRDAMRELAVEILRPSIQLSLSSAVATRLNRAYGAILLVLGMAWSERLFSHPTKARDVATYADRAHLGMIPGWVVIGAVLAVYVALFAIYLVARTRKPSVGEFRAKRTRRAAFWETFGDEEHVLTRSTKKRRPGPGLSGNQPQA